MNKERRKVLDQARALIDQAHALVDQAATEERGYYDAMHENLQSGERGTKADATADALEELASDLEDVGTRIDEAGQQ